MAEYIEREAFMHFLVKQHCENCDKRKGMKNGKERFIYAIGDAPCRSCGVDDALDYIEYFPSADVQQIECGKWIDVYEHVDDLTYRVKRCSVCGKTRPMKIFYNEDYSYNYCPNCGARMDGEA